MALALLLWAMQVPPLSEKVEVRQVVLQVRVIARDGTPVLGLSPEAFRVLVDGQEVTLASAEWVGAVPRSLALPAPLSEGRRGRLVTVLVQRDLQPARAQGLMAFKGYAARLLQELPWEDWVALLVHDSHLRLIHDFTRRHDQVIQILSSQLFRALVPKAADTQAPALASELPREKQEQAVAREEGLLVLAQALAHLPGERLVVVLGWELGRLSYPGFYLPQEYFQAVRLFQENRIPVFSLDITQADWHSLELGLVQVAEDTGGLYAKTHLFPEEALRRLAGALAGYYELSFPRPALPEGVHRVEVQLVGVDGLVLCRRTFADPPLEALP